MKRAAIIAALATLLVASSSYAPCFFPFSSHEDYYQYHRSCDPNCHAWDPYIDWWSLDGTCDTDCLGNTTCEGDTEIRWNTEIDASLGYCDPICE